jgi:hypothetical protein
MTRCFGHFWREWCETNGLPTKVVRQPIPTVPVQSEPDIQITDPAPAPRLLRIGDQVTCDQAGGLFRPCHCGSTAFTVTNGAGPHAAQLRCDACGSGGRWVGKFHMEAAP